MIDAGADDAEGHRPGGDVEGIGAFAAAVLEAAPGEPHGDDDAGEDAQGVAADRQRAEV